MRDRNYSVASSFLAELFGPVTTQAVEIRALPNEHGAGRAASLFTRDPADIEAHCTRWDAIDRAVYWGTATRLTSVCKGTRAGLAELPTLWDDIDCTKLKLDKADTAQKLLTEMMLPPSAIIDSGYGLHGHWWLKEPLDVRVDQPGAAELEAEIVGALKQLAAITAGDPAVCDLARILRLPGTCNTKRGELVPCTILHNSGVRYDYGELLDMLDMHRPVIIVPKAPEAPARRIAELDVFARYAATCHIKPPIDIGARLAAMEYLGEGDRSVHQTQLHVSASMVKHGAGDDEIAELLLKATQEAVGVAGAAWNWQREERNIRSMIATARQKFGNPGQTSINEPAAEPEPEARSENAQEKVVNLAQARQSRAKKAPAAPTRAQTIIEAGDAVIAVWREVYGQPAVVEGLPYTYRAGLWERWGPVEHHALRSAVQGILGRLQIDPKLSLTGAIYKYVLEHPSLRASDVEWNTSGHIVCIDGALEPEADGWRPVDHSPDHWATMRVEVRIAEMGQECPRWLEFLEGCFSDRGISERGAVIAAMQEWFGAALVHGKPRELRKALWLYGESRTGKTRLLEVLKGLVGKPVSSMKVRALESKFGPAALLGKRAWIADDAVGPGDEIDDATFKVVVTGEEFSTDVKNKEYASARLDIPVAFSGNALPKVRDQSEAVYNRCILIPMHVVRSEEETAGKPMIEDVVREHEQAGVFAWGLEGWDRLKKRGKFDPPQSMREAADSFRDQNNPAMAWARDCLDACTMTMVDRRDLAASFHGWYVAEYGTGARVPSQRFLISALRAGMGGQDRQKNGGQRLMAGVRMTDEGLNFREACPHSFGESVGSGCVRDFVNKPRN